MEFHNQNDLFEEIERDIYKTIENISNKYLEAMQSSVQEIVYDPYNPRMYAREHSEWSFNKGFYESWVSEGFYDEYGNLYFKIFSDPEIMMYYPFIHGGNFDDRREIMDESIAEGTNWDFYVPEFIEDENGEVKPNPRSIGAEDNWWTRPRDYFTPVAESLRNNFDKEIWRNFIRMKINYI